MLLFPQDIEYDSDQIIQADIEVDHFIYSHSEELSYIDPNFAGYSQFRITNIPLRFSNINEQGSNVFAIEC